MFHTSQLLFTFILCISSKIILNIHPHFTGRVTHPLTPSVHNSAVWYIGDYFIGIFTTSVSMLSWGDSKSDGPKLVPFLIWLENAEYWWTLGGFLFLPPLFRWFNLYLDLFFKENWNLNRETQNSHCSSQYSWTNDGGWNEGWVTSSEWNGLTCVWTGCLRRIHNTQRNEKFSL